MKKGIKRLIIILVSLVLVLVIAFSSVFILAKTKKIFINKWFVNEKNSTIGVDVSSYHVFVK